MKIPLSNDEYCILNVMSIVFKMTDFGAGLAALHRAFNAETLKGWLTCTEQLPSVGPIGVSKTDEFCIK